MEDKKYGILLNDDIKIHRHYFREMVKLIGIYVVYRAPYEGKIWTTYGELDSNYQSPMLIGCIFDEHPSQQTMKKIGWISELQENASIIHVDYDLKDLQVGAIFIIPSGLDNAKGRLFRVTKMTNSMVYPASITCEIVPVYEDTIVKETAYDFDRSSFNMLNYEDDDSMYNQ